MKYIIDVPDVWRYSYDKIDKTLQLKFCGEDFGIEVIANGEPYIELDRKAIEDEVWEFAKKVRFTEIFDDNHNLNPYLDYFDSYQDAKAKHEEWKKQKDEIRVGDEVVYHGNKYVVGYVGADEVYHIVDRNWIRVVVQGDYQIFKTGRHFPEIAELRKKMSENQ